MQNVHRYFAYVAVLFLFMLSYDVWLACGSTIPRRVRRSSGSASAR